MDDKKTIKKGALVENGKFVQVAVLKKELRGMLWWKKEWVLVTYKKRALNELGETLFSNLITEWVPKENVFDFKD